MELEHIAQELGRLERNMLDEGKSSNTISKYVRDVRQFLEYAGQAENIYNKSYLQKYRHDIGERFLASSANSKISAVNYYLKSNNRPDLCMKYFKVQNQAFRVEERELSREEYLRLMRQAGKKNKRRLYLIMETMATTGIRVSELCYVTVEAARQKQMVIHIKGKVRTVLLPAKLCRCLQEYAEKSRITSGPVFVTRSGRPVDRSNVLHEMKQLCEAAAVSTEKVFPHNLRHLFAVTYYEQSKDICHLADILGHSNINTTRIYTSLSSAECRRRIEKLKLFVEE